MTDMEYREKIEKIKADYEEAERNIRKSEILSTVAICLSVIAIMIRIALALQ